MFTNTPYTSTAESWTHSRYSIVWQGRTLIYLSEPTPKFVSILYINNFSSACKIRYMRHKVTAQITRTDQTLRRQNIPFCFLLIMKEHKCSNSVHWDKGAHAQAHTLYSLTTGTLIMRTFEMLDRTEQCRNDL